VRNSNVRQAVPLLWHALLLDQLKSGISRIVLSKSALPDLDFASSAFEDDFVHELAN